MPHGTLNTSSLSQNSGACTVFFSEWASFSLPNQRAQVFQDPYAALAFFLYSAVSMPYFLMAIS